ncbi:MAG: InlB B-repeat-containing protein [Selenomonadaceae bacterium]|nr:InlB B-repeat-containing protein [Selenomonadaceae bacterium]
MANTTIKALIGFSDGVISLGVGDIASIEATKASAFISGGLAVEYTEPVEPSGSISINANGTYDVTDKASAVVNVSVKTVTYDVNGGTGEVAAATAIAGDSITLNDGTGITAPEGKVFSGWATTDDAEAADVTSPYTVTEDVTLYAVYGVAE